MGLQLGAYFATESVTTVFKRGVARRRPSGVNNRSFPSGHTSAAFAAGTLARRNVAASGFNSTITRALDVGFVSLGVGTSWARVEAGMHYPSDVFAGAALGYFVAALVNDAFVGGRGAGGHPDRVPRLTMQLGRRSSNVGLVWALR
jgi:membrane-associated phospholipid phosphatase